METQAGTAERHDGDEPLARTRRSVRLPFAFGETVYHRSRADRVAGIVTGFVIYPNDLQVYVRWGDDLAVGTHFFFELATEFSPFSPES